MSPQPFHCEMKRHVLPDGQLSGQASVKSLSFSSHPTRGRENNGGKGAELNLSHSLAILLRWFRPKPRVHKNKSMQHHTLGSGTAEFQVT